jgi:hypothetical protein
MSPKSTSLACWSSAERREEDIFLLLQGIDAGSKKKVFLVEFF